MREPKFTASIQIEIDGKPQNYAFKEPAPKELMDKFKEVLGDEKASISVSTDCSIKSFGNGASAMVTVTLSCGQDQATIQRALELASYTSKYFAKQFQFEAETELRNSLASQGRTPQF